MGNFFNKKVIVIFSAAIIIIIFHYAGILPVFERYITFALNPAKKIIYSQGIKLQAVFSNSDQNQNLEEINKELEERNQALLAENVGLQILKDENEALRKQLQFYSKYNHDKVLSNVISKTTNFDQRQIIIIDAGSDSGISVGQPVVAGEGLIIGKIIEVEKNTAQACIVTDRDCRIAGLINNPEGPSGLTQGDLGLTVNMDFVPHDQEIRAGDIITTSGLEAAIPKGLIIGEVQEIKNDPNDLFKTVIIDPAVDINTTNVVSVIIK